MRLSQRSYPHPVLGNADDVPQVAFQPTFEYASDKQFYYVTVTVACSSKTLSRMISKGAACYVLHIECSNTLYRKAFEFSEETKRFSIPAEYLNDTVEVNAFIRATKDVAEYQIDNAHPDYGDVAFEVHNGDILAISEGQTFIAENVDSLRKVGAIMQIEESPEDADHAMRADFNADKIRIILCKRDFGMYSRMKHVASLSSHLTTTIVLPVLIEALHYVKQEALGRENLNWFRNLERRVDALELEGEQDVLTKAQLLLDMPIRRALAAAEAYSVAP